MCEMLAQEFGLGRFDGRHCHQRLVRSLRVILPLFSLSDSPMFSCRLASYTRTTFVVKGRAIACKEGAVPKDAQTPFNFGVTETAGCKGKSLGLV